MKTYLLSDLHLSLSRPDITAAFLHFLEHEAVSAERLFILGDLFEYWVGNDAALVLGDEPILDALAVVSQKVDCYFIAGNRDFLVRKGFAQRTGFTILADETVVDLYGTPTLLLHGDSLCTDDIAHMKFRKNVTTNKWVSAFFLLWPLRWRLKKAAQARKISKKNHATNYNMGIMDVNHHAVLKAFAQHQVTAMIHGHTHRQALHHYQDDHGQNLTRTVLGDWHTSSSLLLVTAQDQQLINQDL